jgi:hypothetical protein
MTGPPLYEEKGRTGDNLGRPDQVTSNAVIAQTKKADNGICRVCSIPGCGKPHIARGLCDRHYRRWKRHGNPLGGRILGETWRFLREVVLPYAGDKCLIWPYSRTVKGYRQIGRNQIVSRLACERVHGPAPSPQHQAAHNCGNGHLGCVNPRHLSWKTVKENHADKIVHGTALIGERNPAARLTIELVRRIRALKGTMTHQEIGARFGVSRTRISMILTGKSWAWLGARERANQLPQCSSPSTAPDEPIPELRRSEPVR